MANPALCATFFPTTTSRCYLLNVFSDYDSFFDKPLPSVHLNVYEASHPVGSYRTVPITEIGCKCVSMSYGNTHTHPFNGPFSGITQVSRYQKGKTNLDFTEARDSEWQWHQLGHMQVCTVLQTDNHASTPPLSFLQAGCPSCRPANSVKALKGN